MVRRLLFVLLFAVSISGTGIVGYYVNEYRHLRAENEELTNLINRSIEFSKTQVGSITSCQADLASCSRMVTEENPQIRDGLIREEIRRAEERHTVMTSQYASQARGP